MSAHLEARAAVVTTALREAHTILSTRAAASYAHITDADKLLAALERDAESWAAKTTQGQGEAVKNSVKRRQFAALMRGQVLRLCAELAEFAKVGSDNALRYVEVALPDTDETVTVGCEWQPEIPARVTGAYHYSVTGDPGDPGEAEICEVHEVWMRGVEIGHLLLQPVCDDLVTAAAAKLRAEDAGAAEEYVLRRAGL